MSNPIFTPDLGIIAPPTLTPPVSKPSSDSSPSADAFEGALSSAVTRQNEADARAAQATRAKTRDDARDAQQRDAQARLAQNPNQTVADARDDRPVARKDARAAQAKNNQDKADAAKPDATPAPTTAAKTAAPDASAKKTASPKDAGASTAQSQSTTKSDDADAAASDDAKNAADASVDGDANAAVAKVGDNQNAGDQSCGQKDQATDPSQTVLVAAPVAAPAPAAPAVVVSVDATAVAAASAEPTGDALTAPTPGAATPALPPEGGADAGAATPSNADAAAQFTSAMNAATGQTAAASTTPSAPTSAATPAAPAPVATQQAAVPTASATQTSAPAAAPTLAAEALIAQQAVAQTAAPQAQAAATAPKPLIPAESSSVASLKDAVDFSVSVTYASNAAAPTQSGASTGFNGQGGAGFGSNGNNPGANPGLAQPRGAATSAIVTQDLALLSQTVAGEAGATEIEAPAPITDAAPEDAAPVDVKQATTQTPASAQNLAARQSFDAPTVQQGAPAGRPHQVLLPLSSQVGAGLVKLGNDGGGEITLRLQPANLGRVDVSMKIGDDGRMTAAITADRQDTLDLLRRDSYALERSLADAGLKTDGGGLQFSLRGESGQGDRDTGDGRAPRGLAKLAADPETAPANPIRRTSGLSRLDMRI